jgi:hypothetical protein
MTWRSIHGLRRIAAGIWMALLLPLCGCDEDGYDHKPPAGQGAIVVENNTSDRLRVYIDGIEKDRVKYGKHGTYDCEPGLRRVALDGDSVRSAWSGEVDVLEGRLTVLVVEAPYADSRILDVRYYFD